MSRRTSITFICGAQVLPGALLIAGLAVAAQSTSSETAKPPLVPLPAAWSFMGNGGPLALPGRCEAGTDPGDPGAATPVYSVRCDNSVLPSFGGARTTLNLAAWRGKRIRVSAELMAAGVAAVPNAQYPDVTGEAGLWIGVITPGEGQRADRMQDRTIKGTTGWVTRDFVVDIPERARQVQAGYWMQGMGQVWMRNLKVEEVPDTVPVNFVRTAVRQDVLPNLSLDPATAPRPDDRFLPPPRKWLVLGEPNFALCDAGIDATMLASGHNNLSIACGLPIRVNLRQAFESYPWQNKRVRLSAWIKTVDVVPRIEGTGATLYLSATDTNGPLYEAVLIGTNDWTYKELVADIPLGGAFIPIGISLVGSGQVWARDMKFEEVASGTPVSVPSGSNR
ncbi:MAG TPA: hypothetical protein VNQ32_07530 [Steroidobacteraceae bacterium]|nr:hypothetical protein [Steroidobacteraceae bacterium]